MHPSSALSSFIAFTAAPFNDTQRLPYKWMAIKAAKLSTTDKSKFGNCV